MLGSNTFSGCNCSSAITVMSVVISNCNVIASGTPSELIKDINAKEAYFGDSFNLK